MDKQRKLLPSRKQCFLGLNIPEATTPVAQERLKHDVAKLREMFTKLFSPGEQDLTINLKVKAVFCLGKMKENGNRRPLKIVLGSEDEVKLILQRVYRRKEEMLRLHLEPEDRESLKAALTVIMSCWKSAGIEAASWYRGHMADRTSGGCHSRRQESQRQTCRGTLKVDSAWETTKDGFVHLCQTQAPPFRQRTHARGPPWFNANSSDGGTELGNDIDRGGL
ncbi:unnamed protein product [Echinostoma caproni]|uniref:VHS domain-containing protein n=1 Tax=Echinostoma caproni TaxID=27848 RepID=A0A183B8S6_9TREM|nr:unnamed protein product [Echinostoma caproni]